MSSFAVIMDSRASSWISTSSAPPTCHTRPRNACRVGGRGRGWRGGSTWVATHGCLCRKPSVPVERQCDIAPCSLSHDSSPRMGFQRAPAVAAGALGACTRHGQHSPAQPSTAADTGCLQVPAAASTAQPGCGSSGEGLTRRKVWSAYKRRARARMRPQGGSVCSGTFCMLGRIAGQGGGRPAPGGPI